MWSVRAAWVGSAVLVAIGVGTAAGKGATATDGPILEVTASRFQFDPETVEVHEGDRVRLRLRATDTVHGFSLKPFKLKVTLPESGEPVDVEFLADRAGVFDFACSEYCGPGHSRMKGRLIVRPRAVEGAR